MSHVSLSWCRYCDCRLLSLPPQLAVWLPLDIYLVIAEKVLRVARKPMSPRDILKRAYAEGHVPARLFGKTQHKTLQARLSEDILLRRDRSCFFRTAPGRFFLREFIADESIPDKHRVPMIARRRQRDLPRRNTLAFTWATLERLLTDRSTISTDRVLEVLRSYDFHYAQSTVERAESDIVVWSFVVVLRDNCVLTYRHGRYREDRDAFLKKRSVGFFTPIVDDDLGLFDQADHGIVASGLRALSVDLDLPSDSVWGGLVPLASLDCFMYADQTEGARDLLALIHFRCPDWFEPLTRRLAINDLQWHDLTAPVNHVEDFDPWSQLVLYHAQLTARKAALINEAGR